MIGQSAGMLRLYRIIERTASSKHPILILGEKGAGKSSLARLIHAGGSLRDHPFVEVNCALPFSPLESALFAPSSIAMGQHALGVRGTVFLRAVAEMPLVLQGRLFRALQEKEIRPPGGGRALPVEARVIAATDRDLDAAVQQGTFRRDLYLRLNVVALRLPPLRERREDIPMLAEHFLRALSEHSGVVYSMSPDTMKVMLDYGWPGNVRELENAMRHAVSASRGALITPAHLPPEMQTRVSSESTAAEPGKIIPLAEVERKAILDTLQQLKGNKQMAAQMLGIGKTTLYRKLKEYGIGRGSVDRHLGS
jgi:two-component system response regulator HydG